MKCKRGAVCGCRWLVVANPGRVESRWCSFHRWPPAPFLRRFLDDDEGWRSRGLVWELVCGRLVDGRTPIGTMFRLRSLEGEVEGRVRAVGCFVFRLRPHRAAESKMVD